MAVQQSLEFRALLKRYRRDAGLTQEELSARAGVSVHAISDLERGVYLTPHQSTVELLADALRLSESSRHSFVEASRSGGGRRREVDGDADGNFNAPERPLIGRSVERAVLERHLTAADSPLVLLAGEPGIGKTRLLQQAVQMGQAGGMTVLSGGCDRRSGQDPYAPVTEAIKHYASQLSRSQLRSSLRHASWLVRLLPELHDLGQAPFPMGALAPGQERRLVFDSVTSFLADSAGPGGLLLTLDDLQWAGNDALDLLTAILKAAPSIRLRAVATYRDTDLEPAHPLATALGDLARAGLVTMVPVTELPQEEAAQLLESFIAEGDPVEPEIKRDIIQSCDGVPFFLISYAEGLRSGIQPATSPRRLPWGLSHSIRQRITSMPKETQELIGAAAVIGRDASVSLLAAVVEQSEESVLQALTPAWRGGLLEESEGGAYRFAHDAIWDVAEADIDAPTRTLLHRRIAITLEQLPDYRDERRPAALAEHFISGHLISRALPYMLTAGDEAEAVLAHAEAERCYRKALEIARATGDQEAHAEASAKLGLVLAESGHRTEARTLLVCAAELYRELNDVQGETRTSAWMTGVLETPQEGVARIIALLERIKGFGTTEAHARLQEVLAYLLGLAGRDEDSLVASEKASYLAKDAWDERLLWRSESLRGRALIELGRVDEGIESLEVMIAKARAAADINEVSGLNYAAWGYVSKGDLSKAHAYLRRALSLTQGYGSPLAHAHALGELSHFLSLICEWEGMEYCLQQLEAIVESVDLQWEEPVALGLLARGQLHIGMAEWKQAENALGESLSRLTRSGETRMLAPILRAQAEMDLLREDHERARKRLEPALERGSVSLRHEPALLSLLAWAQLEAGDASRAQSTAQEAVDLARRHGLNLPLVDALWVQGRAENRLRVAASRQSLEAAGRLARRLHYARGEARVYLAKGEVAIRQEEHSKGRGFYERALTMFRRLRLEPYRAWAESGITSTQFKDSA